MAIAERLFIWRLDDTGAIDSARASFEPGAGLVAQGRIVSPQPSPHWVTYRLEVGLDQVTRVLHVEMTSASDVTNVTLRNTNGEWTVNGKPRDDLSGVYDVDIAGCLFTNTLPVRRLDMPAAHGDHQLRIAFVDVPSLNVTMQRQRYTYLRTESEQHVITFRSDGFESDLTFDRDGFVVDYPQLGKRLG